MQTKKGPERILRSFLRKRARDREQARDLKRLNRDAQRLSAEATDVLEYQAK